MRWFAMLFVLGTQGSSQIAWVETYPINNVKMVVNLLRKVVVSLERKPVVSLDRNQVVNLTEISTSGATSYNWTIPAGSSILGSSSGTSILMLWGSTSGDISVIASTACGISAASSVLNVTVNSCRFAQSQSSSEKVQLYPNPTNGMATLKFNNEKDEDYLVYIKDVAGRSIIVENRKAVKGINLMDFDLSSLAKGIYIIYLKGDAKDERLRIILN
ncbi:MAG: T9SS type A sorting domain-containing protein [Bacteroidota bacterium]